MSDLGGTITPSAMRRTLARARDGKPLDLDEATILLHARGDDLNRLLGIREPHPGRRPGGGQPAEDHHLLAQGLHPADPAVPGPLRLLHVRHRARTGCTACTWSPDEVLDIARQGAELGCKEALFTLGDRPEDRWRQAKEWLDAHGYDDTLSYVRAMAIRVLEETGLLPHLNPGVLSWQDFQRLKPVAPSMGMMLETTATRLFTEQGRPALRQPGQGPGGPAARARGRRPLQRPVHHRHPDRHRRDPGRTRRLDLRHPQGRPRVPGHPGSHRAELPGQAGHQDARRARRRTRRPGRHHRRHPAAPRAQGPHPGPAQPGRRPARPDPARPASTTGAASPR